MTQKAENNLYQEMIESLPEVFWKASPTFDQILYVSPAYETIWGQPREKLYKNSWAWMDSIIPQDKDRVAKVFEGLTKDVSVVMIEYTIILPDGSKRLINDRGFQVKNEKGEVTALIRVAVDITELRMMDRQVLTQYSLNRVFVDSPNMGEMAQRILRIYIENFDWKFGIYWGIDKKTRKLQYLSAWHTSEKKLEIIEREARKLDFNEEENLEGTVLKNPQVIWVADITKDPRFDEAEKVKKSGLRVMCGFPVYTPTEFFGVITLFTDVALQRNEGLFKMLLAMGQQIGELIVQKKNEEGIAYSAEHDLVTGLLNRGGLVKILPKKIQEAQKTHSLLAVLFLDLDHFKNVNDDYGHEVGDELLKTVGERLKNNIRFEDVVARLGGDEFVVVLTHFNQLQTIRNFVQKILSIFNEVFSVFGHHYRMTTSIGVSIFPNDGDDPSTLINMADIAMYKSKEAGRNTFQFCTSEMTELAKEMSGMEDDLKLALEREEFIVYFQPIIDLKTDTIVSVEALLRWNYKDKILTSEKFILLAEDLNLIGALGIWILKAACKQISRWHTQGFKIKLAVNISARQMADVNFLDSIDQILKETHLKANVLDFEITERSLMTNSDAAIKFIFETTKMGINTIIDDFGTGYTSLSYLKKFRIDKLKIDKSFIHGIPKDRGDSTITHAIIALAHAMYATVVAEGVETQEQLDFLKKAGCDEAQGYFYARPQAADEISDLLRKKNKPT